VEQSEAVWLPSEAHLRELLGEQFVSLERRPDGSHVVTVSGRPEGDQPQKRDAARAQEAADAYALALLLTWSD